MSEYIIKEDGTIWSVHHNRPLSIHKDRKGYCRVNMKGVGTQLVHRIIALEYLPNPDNLPQINHLDGDKSNNSITNLEWTTGKKNVEHSVLTGLIKRGDKRPNAKFSDNMVRECRALRLEGWTYYKLADKYGCSFQSVHRICTHQTYTHVK